MTITAEEIPDAAAEAADAAFEDPMGTPLMLAWKRAIAAALNAWPGVAEHKIQIPDNSDELRYTLKTIGLILPIVKSSPPVADRRCIE